MKKFMISVGNFPAGDYVTSIPLGLILADLQDGLF